MVMRYFPRDLDTAGGMLAAGGFFTKTECENEWATEGDLKVAPTNTVGT